MAVAALCVTALIALAGFVVNDRAARKAKRREIRTQFLLSAYGRIEACSNRPLDEESARELELAVADVQLLGTRDQVVAAHEFAKSFADTGEADTGHLLESLRTDLRADLDLEPIEHHRTHLRISVGSQDLPVRLAEAALVSVVDRELEQSVVQMTSEAVEDAIAAASHLDPATAEKADQIRRSAEFSHLGVSPEEWATAQVERLRALADSDSRSAMHQAIQMFEISMAELAHYRAERKGLRLVEDDDISLRDLLNHPMLVSEAFRRDLISLAEWESWSAVRTNKALLQRGHSPAPDDVLNVVQLAELAMLKARVDLLERRR